MLRLILHPAEASLGQRTRTHRTAAKLIVIFVVFIFFLLESFCSDHPFSAGAVLYCVARNPAPVFVFLSTYERHHMEAR
jgi:hypothetical protein